MITKYTALWSCVYTSVGVYKRETKQQRRNVIDQKYSFKNKAVAALKVSQNCFCMVSVSFAKISTNGQLRSKLKKVTSIEYVGTTHIV